MRIGTKISSATNAMTEAPAIITLFFGLLFFGIALLYATLVEYPHLGHADMNAL